MKLFFKILILIFFSINANSETLILGVERDWTAYRSENGDKRTCFISAEPKSSKGDYKKENRGDVRVYVTHGPSQDVTNEVSIKAGYDHKEQSIVKYEIDGRKKFSLFTLKDRAWAETPELDSKIVGAMKSGNKLVDPDPRFNWCTFILFHKALGGHTFTNPLFPNRVNFMAFL